MNKKFLDISAKVVGYAFVCCTLFSSLAACVGIIKLFLRMVGVIG